MAEDTLVMSMTFSIFGLGAASCIAFVVIACLLANTASWERLPVERRPMSVWTWVFGSIVVGLLWAVMTFAAMGFGMSHGGADLNFTFVYSSLFGGPLLYVVGAVFYGSRLRRLARGGSGNANGRSRQDAAPTAG